MGDILKYRFPNNEKQQKQGEFVVLESLARFDGFVVKAFVGDKYFGFQESEVSVNFHPSTNKEPVCYSKTQYLELANAFLEEFKNEHASKAILSRIKKVEFTANPENYFDALCDNYPTAFVYLISSKEFGTWIGATPEVLVSMENGFGKTMALAGTRPTNDNIEWTQKERDEQQCVTDYIGTKLNELNLGVINFDGPKTVTSGPVQHLRTDFDFELNREKQVELIEALHPTPAVCGVPLNESFEMISEIEVHNRALYTGLIGYVGSKTNLYVNLRCSQIIDSECYLYVGGGLTIDSNPEDEWIETENKAKTLLNVMENL
ncbi:MAG: chorismate-binding protein [Crocinitomicaceae bacterium]|nr:chorismate-binding protein [Crocinitomicaceae bacterium]